MTNNEPFVARTEYEAKMRAYDMSEDDIAFMLSVYDKYRTNDTDDCDKTFQRFCLDSIRDNLHPHDIRMAVETIVSIRNVQNN